MDKEKLLEAVEESLASYKEQENKQNNSGAIYISEQSFMPTEVVLDAIRQLLEESIEREKD